MTKKIEEFESRDVDLIDRAKRAAHPSDRPGGSVISPEEENINQNDEIIKTLKSISNAVDALLYYATPTRGALADVEKTIGSAFVGEAQLPISEQRYRDPLRGSDQRRSITSPKDYHRPSSGRAHAGIDIGAPAGTALYAPMQGQILYASPTEWSGAGYTIFFATTDPITGTRHVHQWMHLNQSAKNPETGEVWQPGDTFGADVQLAEVGNTGASRGAHLHYEMWELPEAYDLGSPDGGIEDWEHYKSEQGIDTVTAWSRDARDSAFGRPSPSSRIDPAEFYANVGTGGFTWDDSRDLQVTDPDSGERVDFANPEVRVGAQNYTPGENLFIPGLTDGTADTSTLIPSTDAPVTLPEPESGPEEEAPLPASDGALSAAIWSDAPVPEIDPSTAGDADDLPETGTAAVDIDIEPNVLDDPGAEASEEFLATASSSRAGVKPFECTPGFVFDPKTNACIPQSIAESLLSEAEILRFKKLSRIK